MHLFIRIGPSLLTQQCTKASDEIMQRHQARSVTWLTFTAANCNVGCAAMCFPVLGVYLCPFIPPGMSCFYYLRGNFCDEQYNRSHFPELQKPVGLIMHLYRTAM